MEMLVILSFRRKRKHSVTEIQSNMSSNVSNLLSHLFPFLYSFKISGYFYQFGNNRGEKKEPNCNLIRQLKEQNQPKKVTRTTGCAVRKRHTIN